MVRYAYTRQVDPPAPFVHVTIRPPIDGVAGLELPAQLDTAADLSIIPGRLVDSLGLIPLEMMSVLGFGGHLQTLPTYLVEIRVRGLDAALVKVMASEDEPYVLLGRDVLNQFSIRLDGPNLALEIGS